MNTWCKQRTLLNVTERDVIGPPIITHIRRYIQADVTIDNNGATVYAIINDWLSTLELAITPNIGHDGWTNDVTLSNIHERSLFTSRFQLYNYRNTKASMETP